MTEGPKQVHREAIIAAIAADEYVDRAVLFGSMATGTNTVTSDVDIALFGDRLTLTDGSRTMDVQVARSRSSHVGWGG
ncbi:MAG: nucleotidyltransferase domain-containing protein [Gemmatimonadetes bacterium]|nr:nucleotidyltransferase domain-containing protein [Gemmatimonadota bacterium]